MIRTSAHTELLLLLAKWTPSDRWPPSVRDEILRLAQWVKTEAVTSPDQIERAPSALEAWARTIKHIIRDVAEIDRDPLPGQPDQEMRVTADELKRILEDRLSNNPSWPFEQEAGP